MNLLCFSIGATRPEGDCVRCSYAAYFFFPPVSSPTSPFVPPRFSCVLLLTWCALISALDLSPLPTAPSARGSSACEPTLTWCAASVWWNYSRRQTCQERKEPHQHAEAHSLDSFSLPSTSTQSPLVPVRFAMNSPSAKDCNFMVCGLLQRWTGITVADCCYHRVRPSPRCWNDEQDKRCALKC